VFLFPPPASHPTQSFLAFYPLCCIQSIKLAKIFISCLIEMIKILFVLFITKKGAFVSWQILWLPTCKYKITFLVYRTSLLALQQRQWPEWYNIKHKPFRGWYNSYWSSLYWHLILYLAGGKEDGQEVKSLRENQAKSGDTEIPSIIYCSWSNM
jgi:hypothetical protein